MSWHYQATHRVVNGEDVYEVREVYARFIGDTAPSPTENAISPCGETYAELVECLELMLRDVTKYPVLEVTP